MTVMTNILRYYLVIHYFGNQFCVFILLDQDQEREREKGRLEQASS